MLLLLLLSSFLWMPIYLGMLRMWSCRGARRQTANAADLRLQVLHGYCPREKGKEVTKGTNPCLGYLVVAYFFLCQHYFVIHYHPSSTSFKFHWATPNFCREMIGGRKWPSQRLHPMVKISSIQINTPSLVMSSVMIKAFSLDRCSFHHLYIFYLSFSSNFINFFSDFSLLFKSLWFWRGENLWLAQ